MLWADYSFDTISPFFSAEPAKQDLIKYSRSFLIINQIMRFGVTLSTQSNTMDKRKIKIKRPVTY